jgi:AraC-like DNA-binding protein
MSEMTLRRRIGEDLGQNWRSLLRETRMKVAMQSLRSSNTPSTTIALEIGFASSAALSHAFTQHVGVPPRENAKRCRLRQRVQRCLSAQISGLRIPRFPPRLDPDHQT